MKYMGLAAMLIVLIWSWEVSFFSDPGQFFLHSSIQTRLTEIIQQAIVTKQPQAREIHFKRLWTESVSAQKIRAVFDYTVILDDADTRQSVSGSVDLFQQEDASWLVDQVEINKEALKFTEPFIVEGR